jgi:hypothetical protein
LWAQIYGKKKMVNAVTKADSIFYESPGSNTSFDATDIGPIERQYEFERNNKEDVASSVAGIIFWISLLAAIVGNFIITVILVPFLVMLEDKVTLYIIVMIMGIVFGALFNFLLSDIEHLDHHHHVMTGVVIPVLAVINVYIMVNVSKAVGTIISVTVNQNALVIAIIYVAMFIVPYIINSILKNYKIIRINE